MKGSLIIVSFFVLGIIVGLCDVILGRCPESLGVKGSQAEMQVRCKRQ